jgi:hypothetical protein
MLTAREITELERLVDKAASERSMPLERQAALHFQIARAIERLQAGLSGRKPREPAGNEAEKGRPEDGATADTGEMSPEYARLLEAHEATP